ncbi:hypothetical protein KR009_000050, partial [Drosophila setifemur]
NELSVEVPLANPLEDVLVAELKPPPGRSIFFHEIRCNFTENQPYRLLELTARQACAIESAALHNPNFQVFVLSAGPTFRASNINTQPLLEAILSYGNVHLRSLNFCSYTANTPGEEWLKTGHLFRSRYVCQNIADYLRLITLYRFGGLYLDMDVVVLRSMENISPNYVGAESESFLNSAVLNLSPSEFGREIAEAYLTDFQNNYNGSEWGHNGPQMITRVARKLCGTEDIALMQSNRRRCLGLRIFGTEAFYAVSYSKWKDFFDPEKLEETMVLIKDSFLVHLWNHFSSDLLIKLGTRSAYSTLAEKNCPKAFRAAGEFF